MVAAGCPSIHLQFSLQFLCAEDHQHAETAIRVDCNGPPDAQQGALEWMDRPGDGATSCYQFPEWISSLHHISSTQPISILWLSKPHGI
jgi:hypothetical protein